MIKILNIILLLLVFCSCENENETIIITEEQDTLINPGCSFDDAIDTSSIIYKSDSSNEIICLYPIAEYIGGKDSLNSFLKQNVTYPDSAINNNIEGKVYVGFLVEKDGSISDIKIVNKKKYGYGLEEESIRVVSIMKNWMPAIQNGKPVSVRYTLPISFKIQ